MLCLVRVRLRAYRDAGWLLLAARQTQNLLDLYVCLSVCLRVSQSIG